LRLALAATLVAGIAGFFAFGLQDAFSLAALRAQRAALSDLCATHPLLAPLGYFLLYVAIAAMTLPLNVPLALGAGALFGVAEGLLVVCLASSCGATLSMLSSRFLLRDAVRARFGRRLVEIEAGIARNGLFYLLALRLAPVAPYSLVNLLFGLTAVPAWRFWAITLLGTFPTLLVFVNAGRRLDEVQSLSGLLSPGLIGALAMLAALPLLVRAVLARLAPR
jgi:uncharacterized membrane protein YdjX (TVP38/TMEM64 family)